MDNADLSVLIESGNLLEHISHSRMLGCVEFDFKFAVLVLNEGQNLIIVISALYLIILIFGLTYVVIGVSGVRHRVAELDFVAVFVLDDFAALIFGVGNSDFHIRDKTVAHNLDSLGVCGICLAHIGKNL